MTSVGIRELRQRASEYLRRVAAGETIEVTDRGRPVALLTPIPEAPPLSSCGRPATSRRRPGRSTTCQSRSSSTRGSSRRLLCSPDSAPMSGDRVTYVDSSAIVKLVVRESESAALRRFLTTPGAGVERSRQGGGRPGDDPCGGDWPALAPSRSSQRWNWSGSTIVCSSERAGSNRTPFAPWMPSTSPRPPCSKSRSTCLVSYDSTDGCRRRVDGVGGPAPSLTRGTRPVQGDS